MGWWRASGLVVALLVAGSPLAGQELTVTRVRLDSLGVLTQLARAGFEVAGVERLGIDGIRPGGGDGE